jgi:hypothetical protein
MTIDLIVRKPFSRSPTAAPWDRRYFDAGIMRRIRQAISPACGRRSWVLSASARVMQRIDGVSAYSRMAHGNTYRTTNKGVPSAFGRRSQCCSGKNLLLDFNQKIEGLSDPNLLDEVGEPFLRRWQRHGRARQNGNPQSGTDGRKTGPCRLWKLAVRQGMRVDSARHRRGCFSSFDRVEYKYFPDLWPARRARRLTAEPVRFRSRPSAAAVPCVCTKLD